MYSGTHADEIFLGFLEAREMKNKLLNTRTAEKNLV